MNWTHGSRWCIALLAGVCMVGLLLAGCEDESARQTTPPGPTAVTDFAKDATCPVCKETLGTKGDPLVFQTAAGPPAMVCSKACVTTYKQDPSKYEVKPPAPPAAE